MVRLKFALMSSVLCAFFIHLNLFAQSSESSKNMVSKDLEKFLTTKHNYVKIPITRMTSGHLRMNVVLNGVDAEFILDTGAGATVVELNKKTKFSLTFKDAKHEGAGAGGALTIQESENNIFKLGTVVKTKFVIHAMNLDHVNGAFTSLGLKEVDGVIGADILTENKAIIDYSNSILYLQK